MTQRELNRRHLLLSGLALAGVGLNGCANLAGSPSGGPSIGRVLVLGGGYGGATAARYLKLWGGTVDVTLVERQASFSRRRIYWVYPEFHCHWETQ